MHLVNNSRFGVYTVLAVVVALFGGQAVATVIHSDFDPGGTYNGGTEGWFNYSSMPVFQTGTPTGGSTDWLQVKPFQYYGNITSQDWAVPDVPGSVWNSSTSLEFDILVDDLWLPNNPAATVTVELQFNGVNQYAYPTIDTSLKNVVQHVSIPLAGFQPFGPDASLWNLSINLSPGYDYGWDTGGNPEAVPYGGNEPSYYLDNIVWIPEPATLGLGLTSLVWFVPLATRRRR